MAWQRRKSPDVPEIPQTDTLGRKIKTPDLSKKESLAYVLGTLLGDGCTSTSENYQIRLVVADKGFAYAFAEALQEMDLNSNTVLQKAPKSGFSSKDYYFLTYAYSKSFVEWFNSLDLDHVSQLIIECESPFIRGLYEAEGNLRVAEREKMAPYVQTRIANSDEELLNLVRHIIRRCFEIKSRREEYRTCLCETITSYEKVRSFLEEVSPISIYQKSLEWMEERINDLD